MAQASFCEKRLILRERKQDYIKREREVMHMMTNVPGFVNLSCTFQDQRSLYFVMTYARKGDLLPYINRVGSFDVACTRHYAAELLLACEQMHLRNVVHRDLKPENILLDEDMHTLIADFGSAKVMTHDERLLATEHCSEQRRNHSDEDDEEDSERLDNEDDEYYDRYFEELEDGDEDRRYNRRRKNSFVGTAQYVSPEVLQNGPITPAADLWALGCIVYQMISGLPPFRGSNDYIIFKEILDCAVDFPQGFDKDAEDLVRKLLQIDPRDRLGAQDEFGYYESIRAHPFFAGIDWDTVRQKTPPPIYPYLPGVSQEEDFRFSYYNVPGDLEPGLDERQISRLLSAELGVGSRVAMPAKRSTAKIKVCEKRLILRERKQDYIKREREVMHMMTNVPGFVNLSCTFQDQRSLYFVMTYARKGDLLPYINRVGSFDVACTRHYAAELLLACEQMHLRNVVHRDLKPENILLDEDMHTLIADFGSAKVMTHDERLLATEHCSEQRRNHSDEDDEEDSDRLDNEDDEYYDRYSEEFEDGDEDVLQQQQQQQQQDEVDSPQVLQNGPITPAADLWALGCIVYQMISGLPPFRGSNDYIIFKEILDCAVDFPQGFDKDAEDLVRKLLQIDPRDRLGAQDEFGYYESIRAHPFFAGIDWDTVRQKTPPPIYPYLPGVSQEEDFRSSYYNVPGDLEPGLDERQISRLLSAELGVGSSVAMPAKRSTAKNSFDLSESEKLQRLEQQKTDKWHVFADGEVILKKGFVNKRMGLFARKRMLLLTTGPRLIYIDPVQMIKKGDPMESRIKGRVQELQDLLCSHGKWWPNRTYYLDDPEGYAIHWSEAIENMRKLTYGDANTNSSSISAASCSSGSSYSLAVAKWNSASAAAAAASSSSSPTARRVSPVSNSNSSRSRTGTSPSKKTASK
ncbi:hypothetical protein KR054_010842 [Drosophila jambulina]|nr:hypothetical protein KR054_010842 [Drosophila jambulina]